MNVSKIEAQLGTTRIRRGELEGDLEQIDAKIKAQRAELGASVYLGDDPGKLQDDIDRLESSREGIVSAIAQADKSIDELEIELVEATRAAAVNELKRLNKKAEQATIAFLQAICDSHQLGAEAIQLAHEIFRLAGANNIPTGDQHEANLAKALVSTHEPERSVFITRIANTYPHLGKKLKLPEGLAR